MFITESSMIFLMRSRIYYKLDSNFYTTNILFKLHIFYLTACDCESRGSNGITCDSEGKCECLENFAGQHCDSCKEGYYNYPACEGNILF